MARPLGELRRRAALKSEAQPGRTLRTGSQSVNQTRSGASNTFVCLGSQTLGGLKERPKSILRFGFLTQIV